MCYSRVSIRFSLRWQSIFILFLQCTHALLGHAGCMGLELNILNRSHMFSIELSLQLRLGGMSLTITTVGTDSRRVDLA